MSALPWTEPAPERVRLRGRDAAVGGPICWLAVLLAACAVAGAWRTAFQYTGNDFYAFWAAARAVSEGWTDDIYSRDGRETINKLVLEAAADPASRLGTVARIWDSRANHAVDTVSTPFLYTLTGGWNTGDYEMDYRIYTLLCLGCLVSSVLALGRFSGLTWTTCFALVAFLAAWFQPFQSELRVLNVSAIQLAFIALFVGLQGRQDAPAGPLAAGAVLGTAIAFKPNFAFVGIVVVGLSLLRRRFAGAIGLACGAAAGGLASVAASSIFFGTPRGWLQWLFILPEVLSRSPGIDEGNYGLMRLITTLTGADVSGAAAVALVLAVLWAGRPATAAGELAGGSTAHPGRDLAAPESEHPVAVERRGALLACGLGLAVALLAARLAWFHYVVLIIPLALTCLGPGPGGRRGDAEEALQARPRAGLVPLVAILSLAALSRLVPLFFASHAASAVLANVAVLTLFAIGLRELALGCAAVPRSRSPSL